MNNRNKFKDSDGTAVMTAPAECPACRSVDVKTTSKVANAESYWRCISCGEVWNAGRRRITRSYPSVVTRW